jgi:hypothetical protein
MPAFVSIKATPLPGIENEIWAKRKNKCECGQIFSNSF